LSTGKKTGILTLKSNDKEISLMIKDGKIVNSSSIDRQRKLGEMLVNRGVLLRSELEKILEQQRSSPEEKLIGEILIENNIVPPEVIKATIQLQLEEEIWKLFAWKEGSFKFRPTEDKHFSNILVELDVEPFLLEGSRRLDEWNKIARNIKSEDIVLAINPIEGEEFEREITLSESEWRVLSLINGFYNVGSLVSRSGLSKFETFRILNSFLVAGLIRIKEPQETVQELEQEEQEEESTPPPTPEKPPSEEATPKGTKKLHIKFPFRRTVVQEKSPEQLHFVSPIGALCYFLNTLFQQLEKEEDFITSPNDRHLISTLWNETLMNYPRADSIRAKDNRLDPRDLEFFIDAAGLNSTILSTCYEETLTALKELYTNVFKIVMLRIGEKTSRKLINGILEDLEKRVLIEQAPDFALKEFVLNALES
ncbi:DUF4388 domain-containing protein, partial [Candidatus Sumerlaeota bacterium]|nr:DUF4388 domain-containing protein [Candidatus Sumerlaeota bacterium]